MRQRKRIGGTFDWSKARAEIIRLTELPVLESQRDELTVRIDRLRKELAELEEKDPGRG